MSDKSWLFLGLTGALVLIPACSSDDGGISMPNHSSGTTQGARARAWEAPARAPLASAAATTPAVARWVWAAPISALGEPACRVTAVRPRALVATTWCLLCLTAVPSNTSSTAEHRASPSKDTALPTTASTT